jgi:hypothetical protein
MYRVAYDPKTDRVMVHVSGFWKPEDVAAFATAAGEALAEARAAGGTYDSLVESFDFPVQSNEVADLLTNVMHASLPHTTGRAAIVVGSHLNKLQVDRTLVHPRVRGFMTMAEAEAWLAEKPEQPPA